MQAAMHSVTRVVQDRVSPPSNQTMMFNCDGPVNAMDVDKDMNRIVVAGRQVFKIISIDDDQFTEVVNLRVGKQKNINLSYSAADVAWNHNDENMLASAATNGAVVIWNLGRQVKSKQEFVFMEHKRAVNKVVFHSSEQHQLLSASQDGSMMLHDLRRKQVSLTFKSNSDSVRDVQFCPPSHGYFSFAAAYDSGTVQMWDMRRPDKSERQFTAHNEPVFSLDWHPEDKNWLATAGRDKMIKVWEINKQPAQLAYSVQTIASVGRIKWRPQRRFHIASCSLLLDHSINVWDIRRPYIPFASFDEHKDVATCLIWKDEPHTFLSTGKDSMLIQHIFNDAKRPADSVIPAGIDISIHGDFCCAFREKNNTTSKTKESGSKLQMFRRASSMSRSEQFFSQASSTLSMFQYSRDPNDLGQDMLEFSPVYPCPHDVSMDNFLEMAKNYRLKGQTTEDLCRHNSAVASNIGKTRVSHMWQMLGAMYCTKTITKSTLQVPRTASVTPNTGDKQELDKVKTTLVVSSPDVEIEARADIDKDKKMQNGEISTGSDDDSEGESSEYEKNLANIASGLGHNGDFFFGDGDADIVPYSLGMSIRGNEDWTHLPSEAFQPRHDITGPTAPPERTYATDHDALLVATVESDTLGMPTPTDELELCEQYLNLNIDSAALLMGPVVDFTSVVVETIRFFAEQGDVQTSVSMLIVLGDHVRSHIEEETQENWFLSYIDLLSRFQLWTIACEVIALSHLPQVCQMNQASTTIYTACSQCSRRLENNSWVCDRCKIVTNICCICHHPIKGISVWCQGCCHGGHLHHIQEWLADNSLCPAGCGHHCEYT
ncbi:hypothetical protein BaRGS_00023832 [Batillaria attramentaria]|uniref:GATOR2 complex protein WDR24 n=1 Tax=Batillaria attramentaria TaxID=370345 RepID=A0ABD0KDA6_9CAEN